MLNFVRNNLLKVFSLVVIFATLATSSVNALYVDIGRPFNQDNSFSFLSEVAQIRNVFSFRNLGATNVGASVGTFAHSLPKLAVVTGPEIFVYSNVASATVSSARMAIGDEQVVKLISYSISELNKISPLDKYVLVLGDAARNIAVVGNNLQLFTYKGHNIVELAVHSISPNTFSSEVLAYRASDLASSIPRIAKIDLPTDSTLAVNTGSVNGNEGMVLGAFTIAANVSSKNNLPFLDQLSLSLYCSLSSLSTSLDKSRCNYDLLASGLLASPVANANDTQSKTVATNTQAPTPLTPTFTGAVSPTYITQYITKYIPVAGPAGADGRNGKDGVNGLSAKDSQGGFGGFVNPTSFAQGYTPFLAQSLIGVSTIGYLKDTTIDYATLNHGTSTNLYLANASLSGAVFNGSNTFNGLASFTGTVNVNEFTAASSTLTNSTTTNAYIANLSIGSSTISGAASFGSDVNISGALSVVGTSTLATTTITTATIGDLAVTNSSTTNATSTNFIATNATSTNLEVTNGSTTNSFITNGSTTNSFVLNGTTTNLAVTNASTTNATTTNSFISSLFATLANITDLIIGNATTTNFAATNASTTNLTALFSTTTNSFTENATTTNGFFTNLIATLANITDLIIGNSTTTNAIVQNSTTTNAYIQNLSIGTSSSNGSISINGNLNVNGTSTLATTTTTSFTATQATTTSLYTTYGTTVNGSSTNFFTQNLSVGSGQVAGNQSINGNLTVNGSTTLGNNTLIQGSVTLGTSTSNYITVNGLFNSNLVPSANVSYDLGSPSFYWRNGYLDSLTVNHIYGTALDVSSTNSSTFTVNSDNATVDGEDASLVFFRGLVTPNAVIRWNSVVKRLESNMSLRVMNETPVNGTTTLTVQGGAGQGTTNLFELVDNSGNKMSAFDATGRLGIGTSTPLTSLHIVGTDAIVIPVGTTAQRPTSSTTGMIRYNSSNTTFEGFNGSTWGSLGGVIDTNMDTYVSAENTPGANNDELKFFTFGQQRGVFSSNGNFGIGTTTPGSLFSVNGNSYFGGNIYATGTLNILGNTILTNASTTGVTATSIFTTNLYASTSKITNASTTGITATRIDTNIINASSALLTLASTSQISASTGATIGALNITGTSKLTGAVSASSTLAVTGQTTLYSTLNLLADILPTTDIARSLGTNALRFLNLFSQNIYASSSVITNASTTNITSSGNLYGTNVMIGTTTPTFDSASLVVQGTSTFVGTSASPTAIRAIGNIDNTATGTFPVKLIATATTTGPTSSAGTPQSIAVSGNYAYMTDTTNDYFEIMDISNPSSPVLISTTTVGGVYSNVVAISGTYAYLASGSGLSVMDISNPKAPTFITITPPLSSMSALTGIYISGSYVYISDNHNASGNLVHIFDITNPRKPAALSTVGVGGRANSVFVSGKYAYTANGLGNTMSVLNISNPYFPVVSTTTNVTISAPSSVYVSGRYAYVAGVGGMTILDISNPTSPITVGTFTDVSSITSVSVSGRYAYIGGAQTSQDVCQVDISNPATPTLVSCAGTSYSGTIKLSVVGRYVYVANSNKGLLQVYDVSGTETTSALIHSLEAGNLSVHNDIFANGNISGSSLTVGINGFQSQGNSAVNGNFTVGTSSYPLFFANAGLNNVNIGTSTGAATLFVQGTSTANPFVVASSTGASMFTVNALGGVLASSTLAVTGTTTQYGTLSLLANILPTTDITRSLGTNALRFLNLFSQNIYASSSVITNASTTGVTATNLFSTNVFASTSVLTLASSTGLTATNLYFTNASSTGGLTTTNLFATNIYASSSIITNASTTGITATRIDTSIINASTSVLTNASTTGVTATNVFTTNLYASTSKLTNASTTGITATSIFSTNLYASTSVLTNASTTGVTATNLFSTNVFASTSVLTLASSTGLTATNLYFTNASSTGGLTLGNLFATNLYASTSVLTNASTTNITSGGMFYGNDVLIGTTTPTYDAANLVVQGTSTFIGTPASPTAIRAIGNIDNTATSSFVVKQIGSTASFGASNNPYAIAVAGNYAYVTLTGSCSPGNILAVVDVTIPTSPVLVSTTTVGSCAQGISVFGRYAYIANTNSSTISIVDISNPKAPTVISSPSAGANPYGIYVSGGYAYVPNFSPDALTILDISNPRGVVTVATTSTGGTFPHSVYVSGKYAYVVNYNSNTMSVIDVSNPAAPVLTGTTTTGVNPGRIYVSGRYAYITNEGTNTVTIIDIASSTAPSAVSTATVGFFPAGIYVSGRYAYISAQNALNVVDISNPSSPVTVSSTTVANSVPVGVFVSGRYAYTANSGNAINISVFDLGGLETTSAIVHSLEAGNLSVRNDIFANGNISGSSLTVGIDGFQSQGNSSVAGNFKVGTSSYPLFFANAGLNRVNIGTSTGAATLFVQGTSTANPFTVAASSSLTYFTILANGNVGVGSSSPYYGFVVDNATSSFRDILPATDISYVLGTSAKRFLNLFSQNIYASSSVITNASTTGVTATNIFTTNLYASSSVLTNASTTGVTATNLFSTNVYASTSVLTNASTTGITVNRLFGTSVYASSSVLTNASTTGITATRIDTSIINASTSVLTNASTTGVTATNLFSTNVFASTSVLTLASSTGLTATNLYFTNASSTGGLTITNLFSTGIFASTSVLTLASSTALTATTLYSTLANITNASTTGVTATNIFTTNLYASSSVLTNASTTNITSGGTIYGSTVLIGGAVPQYDAAKLVVSGTSTFLGSASSPTAIRAIGNIDNTATSTITPVLVSTTSLGTFNGITISGKYAYVTAQSNLRILDISDPTSPTIVSSTSITTFPGYPFGPVTISGRYAFAHFVDGGPVYRYIILDISNPATPVTVYTSPAFGYTNIYQRPVISGKYLYINDHNLNTLKIIDISNPVSPVTLSTLSHGLTGQSLMSVAGKYLYLASVNSTVMKVIDISNPANPTIVGSVATGGIPSDIKVAGRFVYVTNGGSGVQNNLSIFDVSSSTNPTLTASTTAFAFPGSLNLAGKYAFVTSAYAGNGYIWTYDVSSSTNPIQVSAKLVAGGFGSTDVAGRYLYTAANSAFSIYDIGGMETTSAIIHSLEVGNLSVRNNVNTVGNLSGSSLTVGAEGLLSYGNSAVYGSFSVGTSSASLFLADSYNNRINIGTSTGAATLFVQGTSTANPFVVASSTGVSMFTVNALGGVLASSTLAVTGTTTQYGTLSMLADILPTTDIARSLGTNALRFLNLFSQNIYASSSVITNASSTGITTGTLYSTTELIGTTTPTFDSAKLVVQGTSTFVGTSASPTAIRAIGNIDNTATSTFAPKIIASTTTNSISSIAVQGKYAYIVSAASGTIQVVDVSNPTSPLVLSTTTLTTNATGVMDILVSGRYAYIRLIPSAGGNGTIYILDISDPVTPVVTFSGSLGINQIGTATEKLAISGKYLYFNDWGVGLMKIFDVSNPYAPVQVGSVSHGGTFGGIDVLGKYAYLYSTFGGGLRVIDVSNPTAPAITGTLALGGFPGSVTVSGRYAYVPYQTTLSVVDISSSTLPVLRGTVTINSNSSKVYVSGRYVYSLAGTTLQVIDVASSTSPRVVSTLSSLTAPSGFAASGHYAYYGDGTSFNVLDLGGVETTSAIVHSLEAGNLVVRDNIFANGNTVTTGLTVGTAGFLSQGYSSIYGSFAVTGTSTFATTTTSLLNVAGDILPTSNIVRSLGTNALRFLNLFSQNIYASSSVITNASTTGVTATNLFSTNVYASTSVMTNASSTALTATTLYSTLANITNASTTGVTATNIFTTNLYASTSVLTNASSTGITTGTLYSTTTLVGTTTTALDSAKLVVQGTSTFVGNSTSPTAMRVMGSIDNTASAQVAPKIVGSFTGSNGNPYEMAIRGNYVYFPSSLTDFFIVDITNPSTPALVSTTTVPTGSYYIAASGKYVYLANTSTITILDVSNASSTVTVSSTVIPGAGSTLTGLDVSGNYLYIASGINSGTLFVVDISNAAYPKLITTLSSACASNGVRVYGSYAYTKCGSNMSIINIENPYKPVVASTTFVGSSFGNIEVYVSGKYAYVPTGAGTASNYLTVVDVSNPAIPVIATSTYVGGNSGNDGATTVAGAGRYVYVGNYNPGNIKVVDVYNPTSPVVLSNIAAGAGLRAVRVSGRNLLYTMQNAGFRTVDLGGFETTAAIIHSLDVGNLSVRNDIFAAGNVTVGTGLSIGNGGFLSQGNSAVNGNFTVGTSSYPLFFANAGLNNINIGTSTGAATLFVQGTSTANPFVVASSTGSSLFSIFQNGSVNIGTTTSTGMLTLQATTGVNLFNFNGSAGTPLLTLNSAGALLFGTTTYAGLQGEIYANFLTTASTTATTTLAGNLNVGSGGIVYDASSTVTSISSLEIGNMSFDTNAGIVSWADLPVTSAAATGTVESYTAQIGGSGVLTVYSESNGIGGTRYPRIGINTATPGSALDVYTATSTSNVDLFRLISDVGSTANVKFRVDSDGDIFTDGGTTVGSPADIAENYTALEAVDAGTVVAFGTTTENWNQVTESSTTTDVYAISGVRKAAFDYEAVGIVSTKAGITLGGNTTNGVSVAFVGRVPVKVTTENGVVARGDYLTVSKTIPGYAMKLTGEGRAIGRAISDYETGKDKVMVLVENGYQRLDLAGKTATTSAMLTTGNLDLNANGVAITNIKSLASANGSWSIDENGRIVAKVLCLEDVCIDKTQLTNILNNTGTQGLVAGTSTTGTTGGSQSTGSGTTTDTGTTIPPVDTGTTTPTIGGDPVVPPVDMTTPTADTTTPPADTTTPPADVPSADVPPATP